MASRSKKRGPVGGGAGFSGSHLCERLLFEGYHPVAYADDPRTGTHENIAHMQVEPNFGYMDHYESSYINVPGELAKIHYFASPASPELRIGMRKGSPGILGDHNPLGVALAEGVRFTLASSSEVRGDPLVHAQPGDYSNLCGSCPDGIEVTPGCERRVPAREGSRRPLDRPFAGPSGREVI